MTTPTEVAIPLSVLDLVPVGSGSTPREALANTVDLARRAEAAGYRRYWVAEHHLNPGVAGTIPAARDLARRRRHVRRSASAPARCRWATTRRCRSSSSSACSTRCTPAASTSASVAPGFRRRRRRAG